MHLDRSIRGEVIPDWRGVFEAAFKVLETARRVGRVGRHRFGQGDGPVPGNHGAEIAQVVRSDAGPTQIDFRDGHRAPGLGLRNRFAGLVEHGRDHPPVPRFHERAADEIDMVLTGTGLGQQRIAAPHRPGNDLRAAFRQFSRDFGKEAVVADHHADLAQLRVEHRIVVAWRELRTPLPSAAGTPCDTCRSAFHPDRSARPHCRSDARLVRAGSVRRAGCVWLASSPK